MLQLLTHIIEKLIHKNKIELLKSIQYPIIIKIIFGMLNHDNIINYYLIYVYIIVIFQQHLLLFYYSYLFFPLLFDNNFLLLF